jgi:hypothetical protein
VFHRSGERALARISRGVIVADVGLLTAAIFISLQGTATFWVVVFLGPVLLGLAHGRSRGPAGSGLRHARAQTSSARAAR